MAFSKKTVLSLAAAFSLLLCAHPAFAGWVIQQEQKVAAMNMTMQSKLSFEKNKVRVDNTQMQSSVIMNLGTGKMYMVMHAGKMFMEMEIAQMTSMMNNLMQQMRAGKPKPKIEVKNTDEKKKVSGFDCIKIIVMQDGKPYSEVWAAPSLRNKDLLTAYEKFYEISGEQKSGTTLNMGEIFKQVVKFGLPIQVITKDPRGQINTSTILSVSETPVPDQAFTPPADYGKKEMPMMPGAPQSPNQPPKPPTPPTPPSPPRG